MIIDSIENSHLYEGMGDNFKKAFEFLKSTDFSKLESGRYDIDGDNVFAIVNNYESRLKKDALLEAHRVHADVQYMAEGTEQVGWAPLNEQEIIEEYSNENDVMFVSGEACFTRFDKGMFAVFLPADLHMPGVDEYPSQVKKVVVKIKVA